MKSLENSCRFDDGSASGTRLGARAPQVLRGMGLSTGFGRRADR